MFLSEHVIDVVVAFFFFFFLSFTKTEQKKKNIKIQLYTACINQPFLIIVQEELNKSYEKSH